MKMKFWFIVFGLAMVGVEISAQARVITNADLEKYRLERLAAERDLRENYERLGFASPEEMEKERKQNEQEREALLRQIIADREAIKVREQQRVTAPSYNFSPVVVYRNDGQPYVYGVSPYYVPHYRQRPIRGNPGIMYRATPGGVIYEPSGRHSNIWPAPAPVRPRRNR